MSDIHHMTGSGIEHGADGRYWQARIVYVGGRPGCRSVRTKTKRSPVPGIKVLVSRSPMMTAGLFLLMHHRSAFAQIADVGLDIAMADPTEAFKICRSRARP
jgi:hypothetical protein